MRFGVLGPLEVWDRDQLVRIRAAKQRIVLAMLLLSAGRVVSADRLVDELWGERPPAQPRGAVHAYVHRLRRVLRDDAGSSLMLVTRDEGYELSIPPDSLDCDRWRRLVADGEAALASGRPENGTALLRRALALWRGPALADVGTTAVRAEARGLDEHRWQVLERCLAAELELCRHAVVLPELRTLAAAHPYREGLHGKLMVALCGVGRQADALAVFTGLRDRLAEDLGVDPGAEVRKLHEAVLRGELDPSPTSVGPPRPGRVGSGWTLAVPRQLPSDVPGFAGRVEHLRHLDNLLATAQGRPVVISAVSGTAGVGKTALAVHWAHRVADRFPDGQLYVNLRGFDPHGRVVTAAEAIRGFLDALGVTPERVPSTVDVQIALYRSLLADKRMLVVLDNARDADQARALLPGAAGCVAVVTSRKQLTGLIATDAAHPITLDVLSTMESRQLLAHRLGTDLVVAEPDPVEAIIAACARLPLALAIAAARAQQTGFPLAHLATELTGTGRLEALDAGDAVSQVRAVFSWSYTALSQPAAQLFRLLGLHPGPDVSTAAAASLAGHPRPNTHQLLAELTRANLLTEHLPGRYTFHDLLRAYAAELTHADDSDSGRRAATARIFDHYLHTAHNADRLLFPDRDPIRLPFAAAAAGTHPEHPTTYQQAMAWLAAEHRVLLTTLRHAADTGFHAHTWQLAWALDTFLHRRGHWHDCTMAWQTALQAAERLGHPTAQADAYRRLAHVETGLDRHDDAHAHLQQAFDLYARAGDRPGQAFAHRTRAMLEKRQGKLEKGLHHAQQALTLFRLAGHRHGQALSLNAVGWNHAQLGDYTRALTHFRHAFTMLQQLDDRDAEAATWDSLGYTHHHLGHHTEAARCYQQALILYRHVGNRYYEAHTLAGLGDTHRAAGHLNAARSAWHQAVTILTDLNHPDADNIRAKLTAQAVTIPAPEVRANAR